MSPEEVARKVAQLENTITSAFTRIDKLEKMIAILAKGHENEILKELIKRQEKEEETMKYLINITRGKKALDKPSS